jgi:glycosyltransferase involved in cell wall biosynthesis
LPVRVALSVDALSPQLTGIGRYCWELAQRLPGARGVQSVEFYVGSARIADPASLLVARRPRPRWVRRLLAPVRRMQRRGVASSSADVVHAPNYRLPDWAERGVVTVHDLSVFKFPEMHPAERVALFERDFQRTLDRASQIITDCETIRNEVIELTGLPQSRVTAVPLGIGAEFRPLSEAERMPVLRKHGLPLTGYGLTVSSLEPRKRIERLLMAWSQLPARLRERYPLVIAGAKGWSNDALRSSIAQAHSEGWAIPLGFVSDADLPAVYAGAALFVYPSIYEGFGLPPLEAMASGVPTLVAAASCLPEVTKGAARLVEPEDVDRFAAEIAESLENEQWRSEAISRGIHVAGGYSWQNCVDQTVQVYEKCIAN